MFSTRFLPVLILATAGLLQTQESRHAFDVAAIRVNHDSAADPNFNSLPGGRLIVTSETLRELMRFAFAVKDFQIAGSPGWIDTERYDIDAKMPDGGDGNLKLALQTLMADRFALKLHRETRELTVYSLVAPKNGPLKMTRHDDGAGTKARTACGHMTGGRVTTAVLATMLSRHLERDVTDQTGLPGKYDFELDWTPDSGPCREKADSADAPSIFTAIQQQLGLKLEPSKGPVEILVIDHVEKPSEN